MEPLIYGNINWNMMRDSIVFHGLWYRQEEDDDEEESEEDDNEEVEDEGNEEDESLEEEEEDEEGKCMIRIYRSDSQNSRAILPKIV